MKYKFPVPNKYLKRKKTMFISTYSDTVKNFVLFCQDKNRSIDHSTFNKFSSINNKFDFTSLKIVLYKFSIIFLILKFNC